MASNQVDCDLAKITDDVVSTTGKGNLIWPGEFGELKDFLRDRLNDLRIEAVKWKSPGGGYKLYECGNLTMRWYSAKGTITVKGEKADEVKERIIHYLENEILNNNYQ